MMIIEYLQSCFTTSIPQLYIRAAQAWPILNSEYSRYDDKDENDPYETFPHNGSIHTSIIINGNLF